MMDLTLIKSAKFNGVTCDFYSSRDDEIWMTREQIGKALEYSDPRVAIAKIHAAHADRLDNFSTVTKTVTVEGGRSVEREVILYSAKGVYEILRWSRQPKANLFYDWVYEMLEALRTGRATLTPGMDKILEQSRQMMQAMTTLATETSKSLTTLAAMTADLRERVEKLEKSKNAVPGPDNGASSGYEINARYWGNFDGCDIKNKCKVEMLPEHIRAIVDEMLEAEKKNYSYIARVVTMQGFPITSPSIKTYFDKVRRA